MSGWLAITSALWLGILTSVSPCPLASNLAAVSFVGRHAGSRWRLFGAGLCYTLGRAAAYLAISAVALAGLLASGELSRFLQLYMNQLLGPLLIITGMLLLEWLGFSLALNLSGGRLQAWAAQGSFVGAFTLGLLFALAFCPVSAGLFFGGLLPLAMKAESRLLLPTLFGIGTALPVLFFAGVLAFAAQQLSRWFNALSVLEKSARQLTGTLFILVGIYYCLRHIYLVL